jgi:hypothetical protein
LEGSEGPTETSKENRAGSAEQPCNDATTPGDAEKARNSSCLIQQHGKIYKGYWATDQRTGNYEMLQQALQPSHQTEAYLTVLNNDIHVSVVHSIIRAETELRPSNPILGQIVEFIGFTRLGGDTPK